MYLLHLEHVAADLRADRQREARARAVSRLLAHHRRASEQEDRRPGALRRAVAFLLIEAGLRLLTSAGTAGRAR